MFGVFDFVQLSTPTESKLATGLNEIFATTFPVNGSFLSCLQAFSWSTYGHEILNELRKAVDFRLACHHVAFDFEVIYFVVRQIS